MQRLAALLLACLPPWLGLGSAESYSTDGIPVWFEVGFEQRLQLSFPPTRLEVVDRRQDPTSGEWRRASYLAYAPFRPASVASARADRFALAGWAGSDHDEFVLQAWSLLPETRARHAEAAPIDPLFPPKALVPIELYRGKLGTSLRGLEFDFEERVVYVLMAKDEVVTLYAFANQAGAQPVAITSSVEVPELAKVRQLQKFQHVKLGRQLVGSMEYGVPAVVFFDQDGDGALDGPPLVGSMDQLEASGVVGYDVQRSLLRAPR